ncbi:MAG: hypothetical protein LWW97_12695 [Deltaproteobacteria bacterium]|nr:hypothetical protein [Deltaproteobacteria bacterium]
MGTTQQSISRIETGKRKETRQHRAIIIALQILSLNGLIDSHMQFFESRPFGEKAKR